MSFCDIVGTGGDGLNTINVSTTSALVAAACGLKVAKHGNRSVSSKSGSSDLLDKMGIKLDMSPAQARRCLDELGICFLFAPQYHAGVRHAMPVRQALKTRTLFNVLGPLINPARPTYQLMGVYAPELVRPIAETLLALGLKTGMVVHGAGLDEIAIHGPTQVAQIRDGEIREFLLTPADFGLETYPVSAIQGGEPEENRAITARHSGRAWHPGPQRRHRRQCGSAAADGGQGEGSQERGGRGAGGAGERQDGGARRPAGYSEPSGSGSSGGMMSATMSYSSHSERPTGQEPVSQG